MTDRHGKYKKAWEMLGLPEKTFNDLVTIGRQNGLTDDEISRRLCDNWLREQNFIADKEYVQSILEILSKPGAVEKGKDEST